MSQHVQREDGKLSGRVRTEPKVAPSDKKCSKCRDTKPADKFPANKRSADGLDHWCKQCRADFMARWREARRKQNVEVKIKRAWHMFRGPLLRERVADLLESAEKARSLGTWRGREGLEAYRLLGEMLEEFKRPLGPTEQDEEEGIVFYDADQEIFGERAS